MKKNYKEPTSVIVLLQHRNHILSASGPRTLEGESESQSEGEEGGGVWRYLN